MIIKIKLSRSENINYYHKNLIEIDIEEYLKGVVPYIETKLKRKVVVVTPKPLQFAKPDFSSSLSLVDSAINIEEK